MLPHPEILSVCIFEDFLNMMETKQDFTGGASSHTNGFEMIELGQPNESQGRVCNGCTGDGSLDRHGKPALKGATGGWRCGIKLLANQGLVTLAYVGVEVNMVLFSKSVLKQTNAEASNTFSRWMGTTYLFSLIGAFLSDSYLGRYLTCVTFQVVLIIGLAVLSFSTQAFLLKPHGCGTTEVLCEAHASIGVAIFYVSIYLIALGNGAPEPALAIFGADQFDEEDPKEQQSKNSFYSYFYVALNLGSLVAETVLVYLENMGYWVLGFWICAACAVVGYVFLVSGIFRYRHFKPSGNPISRFSQVIVASFGKMKLQVPQNGEGLYEVLGREGEISSARRILHTNDFKFLDRAAIITPKDMSLVQDKGQTPNPWHLCTVTQVEEVKCILRLLPIWCCTLLSSGVFVQLLSLFVEQGAAMDMTISKFHIPPASMTAFDIVSSSVFIILYDKFILPLIIKVTKRKPKPPSELQRMGIGLAGVTVAMIVAGIVERQRRIHAANSDKETSSLGILWQAPQYILMGTSEAFVYVAQMQFFASQTPDALKSLGISLSMSSTAIGSYIYSMILTLVMAITARNGKPGWVPSNLNHGHLERYFFLSAALIALNLVLFVISAKRFKFTSFEKPDLEATNASTSL
ncbi:protein NRT1/ PTR FAMILY 7.2 isoform X2 [Hevea brasiliensis]|uniref:protein NRT1/ PTR FAMILY 7.2 isoform X2 n=1 Tax=Hevea brasiliensis TaxID=3981 RepID=UPI0025F978C1|nr:protein NRT1/ PTR FAMILY 7.2 isoform X2 [Hevea brasiliensis]